MDSFVGAGAADSNDYSDHIVVDYGEEYSNLTEYSTVTGRLKSINVQKETQNITATFPENSTASTASRGTNNVHYPQIMGGFSLETQTITEKDNANPIVKQNNCNQNVRGNNASRFCDEQNEVQNSSSKRMKIEMKMEMKMKMNMRTGKLELKMEMKMRMKAPRPKYLFDVDSYLREHDIIFDVDSYLRKHSIL